MSTADLNLALTALAVKQSPYKRLFDYYDGEHPLVYTNRRLEEVFRNLDARFTENWCAVVIDAVADKIELSGFSTTEPARQAELDALWNSLELGLEADDIHKAALVCGESYLIVWPDEDDEPQAYYNEPWLCHVIYESENPRKKRFAAKWWDEDGKRCVTLYYPDHLEYYVSRGKANDTDSLGSYEERMPPADNPYGLIPVFHFRSERRKVKSDLGDVIPIQNGINKLLMDMMVAAEYGAFKQRYIVAHGDTHGLRNAPNEVWGIPAGDGQGEPTQVGEFDATDLDNYLKAIASLASALGAITRTPKHYFYQQGGDPSGEALIAMEAPLNRKTRDRTTRYLPVWRQVGAFLLQLKGQAVKAQDIHPLYQRPETVQPYTRAQTRQINVKAGIPITTQLRDEGWTTAQLAQLENDREAERGPLTPAIAPTTGESPARATPAD